MTDLKRRDSEIATQLTAIPWAAAHGRAERFWTQLGGTKLDEAETPLTGAAWSARAMESAVAWLREDATLVVTWRERGRHFVLARMPAQRPAFDGQQRQALVLSVALDGDRPYPTVHPSLLQAHKTERLDRTDGGDTLARGGLLLSHGLSAMAVLRQMPTARDLLLLIERRAAPDAALPDGAVPISAEDGRSLLAVAACAFAEAGGSPMDVGGVSVLPVPVAQKAALWLRLRGRGRANDPGLPDDDGATDNLLAALTRLRTAERPLRVCAAARAQLLGIAESLGVTGGLAYRGLLNATTYAQARRRLGDKQRFFDALLRDTWTVTRVQTSGRADAAGGEAWALVDCRLVPGRSTVDVMAELRTLIADLVTVELLAERPGKESDLHAQGLRVIKRTMEARLPGSHVVPVLQLAGCDAWGWRQAAVPCLGFAPVQLPPEVNMEALWQRGAVPTLAAERAWGRSVFVETVARYLVDA